MWSFLVFFLVIFGYMMSDTVNIDKILVDGASCYNMDAFSNRFYASEASFVLKFMFRC